MPVPIETYVFVFSNITDPSIKLVGPCHAIRRLRRLMAHSFDGRIIAWALLTYAARTCCQPHRASSVTSTKPLMPPPTTILSLCRLFSSYFPAIKLQLLVCPRQRVPICVE